VVDEAPVGSVQEVLFSIRKRKITVYFLTLWNHIANQHVDALVPVLMPIDVSRTSTKETNELVILRLENVAECRA
jgi:hypothetical protein